MENCGICLAQGGWKTVEQEMSWVENWSQGHKMKPEAKGAVQKRKVQVDGNICWGAEYLIRSGHFEGGRA